MAPEAKEPHAHAPKFAAKKLEEWRAELVKRPEFAPPTTIQAERKEFLESLLVELRRLSHGPSSGRINLGDGINDRRIELIDPKDLDDDPNLTL
ncbi:MAG: hypothetical protein IAG10_32125 [Planctomycetaceae bacterium]|nr:hypothetical protein [Planctomycetaceae bacterium]